VIHAPPISFFSVWSHKSYIVVFQSKRKKIMNTQQEMIWEVTVVTNPGVLVRTVNRF
jgi:hypothetical protein